MPLLVFAFGEDVVTPSDMDGRFNESAHIATVTVTPLPDLTIGATVASGYTSRQANVQIPVTVTRTGGNLTEGAFVTARLYWSSDAAWDAGDLQIQRYPPFGKPCGDADTGSRYGAFSRDAKYGYSLWDQGPTTPTYLNVVGNRAPVFALAPPAAGWGPQGGPRMPVWSPVADRLYYEQQGNLWTWTPADGPSQLKSGLRWIDPAISPDGKRIAYAVRGADGRSIVHVMDAASLADQGTVSAEPRKRPFFLTNDLIWWIPFTLYLYDSWPAFVKEISRNE